MSNNISKSPILITIASGQQNSNVISRAQVEDANLLGIIAPSTLTGAITIEVCDTESGTFVTLNNGTSDVAGPVAGKAYQYDVFAFPFFRLHSASAEGAERVFKLFKVWNAW